MKRSLLLLGLLACAGILVGSINGNLGPHSGMNLFTTGSLGTSRTECTTLYANDAACKSSNGCAGPTKVAGTNFNYSIIAFAGTVADDFGAWTFQVPANFTGTTATVVVSWLTGTCTATTNDDVCLALLVNSASDGEAWVSLGFSGSYGTTDTCAAADAIQMTPQISLTVDWAPGDLAVLQLYRDIDASLPACSDDDIGNDVWVLGVELCYEVDNVFSGE